LTQSLPLLVLTSRAIDSRANPADYRVSEILITSLFSFGQRNWFGHADARQVFDLPRNHFLIGGP